MASNRVCLNTPQVIAVYSGHADGQLRSVGLNVFASGLSELIKQSAPDNPLKQWFFVRLDQWISGCALGLGQRLERSKGKVKDLKHQGLILSSPSPSAGQTFNAAFGNGYAYAVAHLVCQFDQLVTALDQLAVLYGRKDVRQEIHESSRGIRFILHRGYEISRALPRHHGQLLQTPADAFRQTWQCDGWTLSELGDIPRDVLLAKRVPERWLPTDVQEPARHSAT